MAAINVKDLGTQELLSSEALSEVHGGRRSAIYPAGSSFKPFVLASALADATANENVSDIDISCAPALGGVTAN